MWSDTCLPGIAELCKYRAGHGDIKVCIGEHDEGGIPAQLQGNALHGVSTLGCESLAPCGRAGKAQFATRITGSQRATDFSRSGAVRRDHVQHAARNAGSLSKNTQSKRGEWRVLCR